jgi:ribosomal-protein-serine acetyltransferase
LKSGYGVPVKALPRVLPDRIEGGGVLIRRWLQDDAESLTRAVGESHEHLRPWMAWITEEPQTLEQRKARIREWERKWLQGGDVILGIFVDDEVAGGCGLHRRGGPSTLEIGYWIHPSFTGRGLATTVARLLTDAAFSLPGIEHVEIHSDKANTASAGVPRRLGFRFLGETPDEPMAPAEVGIDCAWRIDRASWQARRAG